MHRGWNCGDYFADGITNGASWYSLSKGKCWAGEHHPQQGVELKRHGGVDKKPQNRMGWRRALGIALCPFLDRASSKCLDGVCISDNEIS